MDNRDYFLAGDSVIVRSVSDDILEDYLTVKRYASPFKLMYDRFSDAWDHMKAAIIGDLKGPNTLCVIYQKEPLQAVGYIELETNGTRRPNLSIGILEDARNHGFATEATKLLVEAALQSRDYDCILWKATDGNVASNRVAQKLGGQIVKRESLLPIKSAGDNGGKSIDDGIWYTIYELR